MDLALPGVHHAAGEQPHVVAGGRQRPWRSGSRGSDRRRASGPGHQPGRWATAPAVVRATRARWLPEHPVGGPLPATARTAAPAARGLPSMSRPNGTDDGHADSQARHCTQVCISRAKVASGAPGLVDGAHGGDAAPGGEALLAGHPVGRAVGQAQAAGDARGQVVGVDAEPARPAGDAGTPSRPTSASTDRPGLSRPSGSNRAFRAWCKSDDGRGRRPAGPPAGQPPPACSAPRPRRPRPATRPPDRPCRLGRQVPQRRRAGATCAPARAEAGARRPGRKGDPSTASAWARHVGSVAGEAHPGPGAVPQHRQRPVQRRGHGERIGVLGDPPRFDLRPRAGSAGPPRPSGPGCPATRPAAGTDRSRSRS